MNRRNSIRLLGAAGTLATLFTASPAFGDGALAIEDLEGERAGLSAGHATTQEAQQAALAHCGEGCSVVETFFGGCAAVATHEGEDSTIYGWFVGVGSESEAISEALEACRERGGTDCAVRLSACDGSEPAGANEGADAPPDHPGSARSAGETSRDCPNCPEMVVIPAGTFRMGCLSNDNDCYEEEFPVHEVTIRSFALSKYEVTFDDWDACVSDGGCGGYRPDDSGWGRGARPVINVSWEDAHSFAAWLSRVTGHAYRLPTESEWEYAARAGAETKYSWGNGIGNNQANCAGCGSQWEAEMTTAPAGSFGANAFGLHDMHGNVWEWVEDCSNGNYSGAPSDGSAWPNGNCEVRVSRGGSWGDVPRDLRSASRYWLATGNRHFYYGFRVARTLTP